MTETRYPSTSIWLLTLAAVLGLLLSGCREGVTPTEPTQKATLSIQASSSGAPAVSAVRLTISSITLTPASGGSDVVITAGSQTIDLIQLQQALQQILLTLVPAGNYSEIRIHFDESTSEMVETSGGSPQPLTITAPVAALPLSLQLASGDDVTLQLSFDAGSSLRKTASGDWVFTPFLQIVGP